MNSYYSEQRLGHSYRLMIDWLALIGLVAYFMHEAGLL